MLLPMNTGCVFFYMRDFDTKSMLIVPDKQMKRFYVCHESRLLLLLSSTMIVSQLAPKYKSSREIFVELKVNWPVFLIVLMSLSEFIGVLSASVKGSLKLPAFSHRNQ